MKAISISDPIENKKTWEIPVYDKYQERFPWDDHFPLPYPWENKENIRDRQCLHKSCPDCHGTGRKRNGQMCVHMISCPCPRCSPTFMRR